ncbi:MAG: group 1 glycosyl [Geobacteraceae bacterium]|nr:MAG: group 1 glycosyl [Geobacteraceae bacterium]
MKILLAHNFYRSSAPSGEDTVYRNERTLLEANGVEVIHYESFNDDIDESTFAKRVRLALNGAWSRQTYDELSALIVKTQPDLAHFHNTFPLITPSAWAACRDNGVPVVQTLHNFRFICPGALLMRQGRPCEECVGTSLAPALRHRCYRGALLATLAQVWTIFANRRRGSYGNLVDRYVALTRFAAGRFIAGGLPRGRLTVLGNFLLDPPPPGAGDGGYAIFVGRLSEEKGVRTLLASWEQLRDIPLKIVGDGPLKGELEEIARRGDLPVEFLGFRPREEVMPLMGRALLQVIPSECYEGFPLTVLEAWAGGTPVVASRLGGLDEIVEEGVTGVKFTPANPADLADKVRRLVHNYGGARRFRQRVRRNFELHFSPCAHFDRLREIYAEAIMHSSRSRRRRPFPRLDLKGIPCP